MSLHGNRHCALDFFSAILLAWVFALGYDATHATTFIQRFGSSTVFSRVLLLIVATALWGKVAFIQPITTPTWSPLMLDALVTDSTGSEPGGRSTSALAMPLPPMPLLPKPAVFCVRTVTADDGSSKNYEKIF